MSDSIPPTALVPPAPPDLCLRFANTCFWRGRERPVEALTDPGALAAWLEANALHGPPAGLAVDTDVLAHALAVREAAYRTFAAVAAGRAAEDSDLAALNLALAAAPARNRVSRHPAGYAWEVSAPPASGMAADRIAANLLAPVLWSAADLLVSGDPTRIRLCANPECLWVFLDQSRSGVRRWCDMASCGNRAKARRHYLRHKTV